MTLNLFLADDDIDDCLLFRQALEQTNINVSLTTVHDGQQLIDVLTKDEKDPVPHVLFLDLNMPRKNGFESLSELRQHKRLRQLPVIIYSTADHRDILDRLYEGGAHYYIRKPSQFLDLVKVIEKALRVIAQPGIKRPSRESFLIATD